MIDLYIFDMGGVVSRNTDVTGRIAEHFGFAVEEWWKTFGEDFIALMAGSITSEQFWRRFSEVSGKPVQEDLWALYFQPELDPLVVETIYELKGEARVVVGTNTIESHYRVHKARGDYDIFDRVYASQRMRRIKPDPSFYTYILDSEGCPPERAVFVDDAEVNVEAAGKLGIHAILFTDAARLRSDLAASRNGFPPRIVRDSFRGKIPPD
jgi:HAD superfamily hydrolase (TIGR01509 family)